MTSKIRLALVLTVLAAFALPSARAVYADDPPGARYECGALHAAYARLLASRAGCARDSDCAIVVTPLQVRTRDDPPVCRQPTRSANVRRLEAIERRYDGLHCSRSAVTCAALSIVAQCRHNECVAFDMAMEE